MGENLASQIATGAVTLVVGWLLLQMQEGNLRRRRRREIREELELADMLGEHPQTKDRLLRRIGVLLEQYEPSPERLRHRRTMMIINSSFLVLFVVIQWSFFDALLDGDIPLWLGFVIGCTSAVFVASINLVVSRFGDVKAQDAAAAGTMKLEGVMRRPVAVHPQQTDKD